MEVTVMTREDCCARIEEAIDSLDFNGEYIDHVRYENGHINDTFHIRFRNNEGNIERYILQRMNHDIFKNPDNVMTNISRVTTFLKNKIAEAHGDVRRETLNVVRTKDGGLYYKDSIGSYWRAFFFIEDAICYDQVKSSEDFYQSAYAFGHFQKLLENYNAEDLYETIPDFHNTPARYQVFLEAVKKDVLHRAGEVQNEIEFLIQRSQEMNICMEHLKNGKLPLRVTHNDTKLNNVMIDSKTGRGICIIDLDTVMPGLSIFDFGDAIRFGANTAVEDERDLSKVSLDLDLFECYTRGYFEGCDGSLTPCEIDMLPMGAKIMTLECGMRFLTDYLQGDTYFRIHREGQNLDRCRTQLRLVEDMESKWDEMKRIVEKYR
jgi:serine/threonine protein kinase